MFEIDVYSNYSAYSQFKGHNIYAREEIGYVQIWFYNKSLDLKGSDMILNYAFATTSFFTPIPYDCSIYSKLPVLYKSLIDDHIDFILDNLAMCYRMNILEPININRYIGKIIPITEDNICKMIKIDRIDGEDKRILLSCYNPPYLLSETEAKYYLRNPRTCYNGI